MSGFGLLETGGQREAVSSQSVGKTETSSMLYGNIYVSSLAISHCHHKILPMDINPLPCFRCQSKIASWHFISCFTG